MSQTVILTFFPDECAKINKVPSIIETLYFMKLKGYSVPDF